MKSTASVPAGSERKRRKVKAAASSPPAAPLACKSTISQVTASSRGRGRKRKHQLTENVEVIHAGNDHDHVRLLTSTLTARPRADDTDYVALRSRPQMRRSRADTAKLASRHSSPHPGITLSLLVFFLSVFVTHTERLGHPSSDRKRKKNGEEEERDNTWKTPPWRPPDKKAVEGPNSTGQSTTATN